MDNNQDIKRDIAVIRRQLHLLSKNSISIGDWIEKKSVMNFFDYGDTQIRNLEKENKLTVSKIGRRKFYSKESIIKLIEKNIK